MTQPGHESATAESLQELVRNAEVHRSAAHLERAVRRWSRDLASPSDAVALAGVARAGLGGGARRLQVLDRATQLAVTAVAERQLAEALVDPLTGLATRSRMQDEGEHLLALSRRSGEPLTAVVLDVDGLKQVNDQQGHGAGDAALAEVGRAVRQHLRAADRAFRWGGDEFVLLLPGATPQEAHHVVDRIQHSCRTPTSVGTATLEDLLAGGGLAALLAAADTDLYSRRRAVRTALAPRRLRRAPFMGAREAALVALLAVSAALLGWTGATLAGVSVSASAPARRTTQALGAGQVRVPVVQAPQVAARSVAAAGRAAAVTRSRPVAVTRQAVAVPAQVPVAVPAQAPAPSVVPAVQVPLPPLPVVTPPTTGDGGLVGGVLGAVHGLLSAVL